MWEQVAHHAAKFRVSDWTLEVDTQDGCLKLSASSEHGVSLGGRVELAGMRMPPVTESFVRGDELHLVMPQTDGCDVGLELALIVIEADSHLFVLETVISLQTQWLDLHPRVDFAYCSREVCANRWMMKPMKSSRWYDPDQDDEEDDSDDSEPLLLAILIDQRDRFSINESGAGGQQLSFFGDFMEKGVIRKVQPWWVWSREELVTIVRQQLVKELAARPLPLAT